MTMETQTIARPVAGAGIGRLARSGGTAASLAAAANLAVYLIAR